MLIFSVIILGIAHIGFDGKYDVFYLGLALLWHLDEVRRKGESE